MKRYNCYTFSELHDELSNHTLSFRKSTVQFLHNIFSKQGLSALKKKPASIFWGHDPIFMLVAPIMWGHDPNFSQVVWTAKGACQKHPDGCVQIRGVEKIGQTILVFKQNYLLFTCISEGQKVSEYLIYTIKYDFKFLFYPGLLTVA